MSKHVQIGTGKRVRTLIFLRVVKKRIIADAFIENQICNAKSASGMRFALTPG